MRSVRKAKVQGKRVLVRLGFNVALRKDQQVSSYGAFRIRALLPTLEFLISKGARLICVSHLGRPAGQPDPALSFAPVVRFLSSQLKKPIFFEPDFNWPALRFRSQRLKAGEILFLENLRFLSAETQNSPELAENLASLADVYVNEAFSVSHRAHASIVGVPKLLPGFAGFRLLEEVAVLGRLFSNPQRPFTLILGGLKMKSKVEVLKQFWDRADYILLGGVPANTILRLRGVEIGSSIIELQAAQALGRLKLDGRQLHLPVDAVVSSDPQKGTLSRTVPVSKITPRELILDIGPNTLKDFQKIIGLSKTVVWNGPMGKSEVPAFRQGTLGLARVLAKSKAFRVIGGGDSVTAVSQAKLLESFDFVSTGGGAMLEFLAGKKLPGLEALEA